MQLDGGYVNILGDGEGVGISCEEPGQQTGLHERLEGNGKARRIRAWLAMWITEGLSKEKNQQSINDNQRQIETS